MNTLKFHANVLTTTDRYSSKLALPDYPYTPLGEFDREKALSVVLQEEYGFVNAEGLSVSASIEKVQEKQYAGKSTHTTVRFSFCKDGAVASFPVNLFQPVGCADTPMIVFLNFFGELPNRYLPVEELMDRGVSVAHIFYKDVTSDDGDFETGIAPLLTDRSDVHAAGKIALWAFAAQQVATWLLENGYASVENLYVAGHSRLGKTALLTAAQDTRFAGVLSNCSGCSGIAISREKDGETIEKICNVFPYWFAKSYHKYANREDAQPFDQHYLLSLVAPRKLCIVTAEEDLWADTDAQYLAAEAADVIYKSYGCDGLCCEDAMLRQGENVRKGRIAFSKRSGTHFLSRDDWNFFIDFIQDQP